MRATEWRILILLVVSIFINYIDRGNLSIAAPLIRTELSVDASQLGALLAAFFWTYALCQLFGIAGWLVDRFDVGLVYAAGFFLWSGDQPRVSNSPWLREIAAWQGEVCWEWLAERRGWI